MKLSVPVIRWVLGVFFVLSTLVELSEKAVVSGIASAFLAALLIPPIAKAVFTRLKRPVPTVAKIGLAIVLFFVVVATASSSTKKTDSVQPALAPTSAISVSPATSSATVSTQPSSIPELAKQQATLLRVIDGDTIEVSINGQKETIRIIGINTPETVDPRKSVECFGREASQQAKNYFEQSGKEIWLEADPSQGERDKYKRLLRYVFTDDASVDYGKVMLSLGYANEYTYNTPYKYQAMYKQAEQAARDAKQGLWADNACPVPTAKPTSRAAPTKSASPVTNSGGKSCQGPDLDCGDFASRSEVLQFWNACGFSASNDPHRLDGNDNDGQPCESL